MVDHFILALTSRLTGTRSRLTHFKGQSMLGHHERP